MIRDFNKKSGNRVIKFYINFYFVEAPQPAAAAELFGDADDISSDEEKDENKTKSDKRDSDRDERDEDDRDRDSDRDRDRRGSGDDGDNEENTTLRGEYVRA